jgi:hypothetical protein
MLDQLPLWRNGPLILYHGTLQRHAASILRGIDPAYFKPYKDFGRGFYLTTSLRQASLWARRRADRKLGGELPAVLRFVVPLDELSRLETLAFVRSDYEAEDFWSLVAHCRGGNMDHGRPGNGGWYDVVAGPVAAFWEQRACYAGADQISFHTSSALALLQQVSPEVVT